MKAITSALILLFLFKGVTQAQVEFGVKGGLNIADVSNLNGSNRVSGHLGFLAHKTLDAHWCVQPELLYSFQGQKYPADDHQHTLALDYIQIPVMVQYFPVKQFYVEFGPQLAFLTNAKIKMDNGSKTEVDNDFTSADFSVNIGLGYMATQKVGIYGRYVAGLSDISKSDNNTYHNRVGQIGVLYRFK